MTLFCTVAGIGYGALFALVLLSCLLMTYGADAAIVWGVVIGVLGGGAFGLIFGLISGIVLAKATDRDMLYIANVEGYKQSMKHKSQSVALAGILAVSVLSAVLTIPDYGWKAWLLGASIFVLIPGLIAVFAFRWASKRVVDWVVYVQNTQRN